MPANIYLNKLNKFKAKDIMDTNLLIVDPQISIYECMFLMIKKNISDLIIKEDKDILGVATFNDFTKIMQEKDADDLLQRSIMFCAKKDIITATGNIKAVDAKNIMRNKGIGRLPIVEDGELIGIIRIKDIINKLYGKIAGMNDILFNILNTIHEAVCIVDKNGKVIMWGKRAEKLYGIKGEEIISKKLKDFFSNALLYQVIEKRKAIENVYHNPKEGIYTIISAMPLFIDGEFIGAVSTDRDITEVINLSIELEESKDKLHYLQQEVEKISKDKYSFGNILGKSRVINEKIERAQKVARTNANILITGESGTGKELFARSIHQASGREGPLITVNCSAIPENLFESEMFGYVSGAFTGALKKGKAGYFELADQGTLFLDEIGDMPMFMQSKLLRALQEGKIKRVAAENYIDIDVRVISATNRNLEKMVRNGEFREDLFYRINGIKIEIPSLRARKADIPILVNYFIKEFCEKNNFSIPELTSDVLTVLMNYYWKGNIRELKNVVEHLVIFSKNDKIDLDSLPDHVSRGNFKAEETKDERILDLEEVVKRAEIDTIKRVMKSTGGNKSKAAKKLNIPRSTLYYKIKYYDLNEFI